MNPRLTIVTPSLNQAAFLEQTIDSVLSQNYPNLEYIVVDGGSTDGSVEIIRRHERYLTHWESRKDTGPPSAINRGFGCGTGEILAYLNSDDTYEPGAIAGAVEALQKQPRVGVVYGDIRFIDEFGKPTTFPGKRATLYRAAPFIAGALYHNAMFVPQQASFWRRATYDAAGPMNEENWTCWDHEFFIRASLAGYRFSRIPHVLAAFRIHPQSISSENRWEDRRTRDHQRIDAQIVAGGYKRSAPMEMFYRCCVMFLRSSRYLFPGL